MNISEKQIGSLLQVSETFKLSVPFYQRPYVWTVIQATRLLQRPGSISSAVQAGSAFAEKFLATIVFQPYAGADSAAVDLEVVDGQQRLLSAYMLNAVLLSFKFGVDSHDLNVPKLKQAVETDLFRPQPKDRENLLSALERLARYDLHTVDTHSDTFAEIRSSSVGAVLLEYVALCQESIKVYGDDSILTDIAARLHRATVAQIVLSLDDDANEVFEALNTTGLQLTGADHIRNLVMGIVDVDRRSQVYHLYWQPIIDRGVKANISLESLLMSWIRSRYRVTVNQSNLYSQFKACTHLSHKCTTDDVIGLLTEIRQWVTEFAAMKTGAGSEVIVSVVDGLSSLGLKSIENFGLMLTSRLNKDYITLKEAESSARLVESYVVRQLICGKSKSVVDAAVSHLSDSIWEVKKRYSVGLDTAIGAALKAASGGAKFPTNSECWTKLTSSASIPKAVMLYIMIGIEKRLTRKDHSFLDVSVEPLVPLTATPEWEQSFAEFGISYSDYISVYGHTLANYYLCEDKLSVDATDYASTRKSLKKSEFTTTRGAVKQEALMPDLVAKRLNSFVKVVISEWPMVNPDLALLESLMPEQVGTALSDLTDTVGWKPEKVIVFGQTFGKDLVKSWKSAVAIILRSMCEKYLENNSVTDLLYAPAHEFKGSRIFASAPFTKNSVLINAERSLYANVTGSPNTLIAMLNHLVGVMGLPENQIFIKIK